MGFLDRLLGRDTSDDRAYQQPPRQQPRQPQRSEDEIAVERYNYLLRTAPPETIEQVHQEAFSRLTEQQRDLLFQQLTQNAPAGEQPRGNDPQSLAQSATRSELRQPGTLQRAMAPVGQNGPSFGSMLGSSLLGTVAGYVIGSAIVSAFLPPMDATAADGSGDAGDSGSGDGGSGDTGSDTTDASADYGGDAGGDYGGYGDFGGGDFGGGDFGGGDFGGGDFGGF